MVALKPPQFEVSIFFKATFIAYSIDTDQTLGGF